MCYFCTWIFDVCSRKSAVMVLLMNAMGSSINNNLMLMVVVRLAIESHFLRVHRLIYESCGYYTYIPNLVLFIRFRWWEMLGCEISTVDQPSTSSGLTFRSFIIWCENILRLQVVWLCAINFALMCSRNFMGLAFKIRCQPKGDKSNILIELLSISLSIYEMASFLCPRA